MAKQTLIITRVVFLFIVLTYYLLGICISIFIFTKTSLKDDLQNCADKVLHLFLLLNKKTSMLQPSVCRYN